MRLGAYDCSWCPARRAYAAYRAEVVVGAASPSLRVQQQVSRPLFEQAGMIVLRHDAGRQTGRGDGVARTSVVRRRAVPSGVQVEAEPGHPLFRAFVAAGLAHKAEKKADPGRSRGHQMVGVG